MKQKRDVRQLVGDDGELLVPFSQTARKRKIKLDYAEHDRTAGVWFLSGVVLSVGLLLVGLLVMLGDQSTEIALPTFAATPIAEVVTSEVVTSGGGVAPTLPPTWTPNPTHTLAPSQTPTQRPTTLSSSTPSPVPSSTIPPQIITRRVEIRGRGEWQSAGLIVRAGDVVKVEYVEGRWKPWYESGWTTANGNNIYSCPDVNACLAPVPDRTWGALVARVAEETPLFVGAFSSFVAQTDGDLLFRMNDPDTSDNQGSLILNVTLERPQQP